MTAPDAVGLLLDSLFHFLAEFFPLAIPVIAIAVLKEQARKMRVTEALSILREQS